MLLNGINCNLESFLCKISLLKRCEKNMKDEYHILTTVSLLTGSNISGKTELKNICRCNANIWQCNFIYQHFVLLDKMLSLSKCRLGFQKGLISIYFTRFTSFLNYFKTQKPYSAGVGLLEKFCDQLHCSIFRLANCTTS